MSRGWKILEVHARERLDCLEETVGRNSGINQDFGESSEKKRGEQ